MFKRFWQRLNYWADALSLDDPHGAYMIRLQDRVAKLEREILRIKSRTTPAVASLGSIYAGSE